MPPWCLSSPGHFLRIRSREYTCGYQERLFQSSFLYPGGLMHERPRCGRVKDKAAVKK